MASTSADIFITNEDSELARKYRDMWLFNSFTYIWQAIENRDGAMRSMIRNWRAVYDSTLAMSSMKKKTELNDRYKILWSGAKVLLKINNMSVPEIPVFY